MESDSGLEANGSAATMLVALLSLIFFAEIEVTNSRNQRNKATASINSPKKIGSTIGGTSQSRSLL